MNKKILIIAIVLLFLISVASLVSYRYLTTVKDVHGDEKTETPMNQEKESLESQPRVEIQNIETQATHGGGTFTVCSDECGNGVCQKSDPDCKGENAVCICPETSTDCPQDCK